MKRARILFVDDASYVLHSIRRLLEDMTDSWDMEFSSDPVDALDTVRERRFDVVVADMQMPDIDGITFLRIVKSLYPDTECMVLTGDADTVCGGPEESMFRLIEKPCDSESLRAAISACLEERHDRDQQGGDSCGVVASAVF